MEFFKRNKLIAIFMGWYINTSPSEINKSEHRTMENHNGNWSSSRSVWFNEPDVDAKRLEVDTEMWTSLCNESYGRAGKYHKSWDALMEVVEEINKLDDGEYSVCITPNTCRIIITKTAEDFADTHAEDTTKLAVYNAVCEFLGWYKDNE